MERDGPPEADLDVVGVRAEDEQLDRLHRLTHIVALSARRRHGSLRANTRRDDETTRRRNSK
jgi:hypothetical protein